MEVIHPRWSSATFLVYLGGLTVIAAAAGWGSYLASHSGTAGDAAWALLVFIVVALIAEKLRRGGHRITAGVFAFGAVTLFVVFVARLFTWFGWDTSSDRVVRGFHPAQLLAEILWLVAAIVALRRFRAPFIVSQAVLAAWLFVTDFVSNGGWWTAFVSIVIGLVVLAIALTVDNGPARPYGFWLHLAAGLFIGAAVIWWIWHDGWFAWLLVALASLAYIRFASAVGRSSWAVLGAIGLFMACDYFVLRWTHVRVFSFDEGSDGRTRDWVPPLLFTLEGALLVALGWRASRR